MSFAVVMLALAAIAAIGIFVSFRLWKALNTPDDPAESAGGGGQPAKSLDAAPSHTNDAQSETAVDATASAEAESLD